MEFAANEGQEVLILDGDEKVRRGLGNLLGGSGLVPTAMSDPERALELAREKYFAVAVVDLDTPRAGEGVGIVARLKQVSPATVPLMMASRRTFEVAVSAFRAGAVDVVVKTPDQVEYLRDRIVEAAATRKRTAEDTRMVEDTLALHEEMMRLLLDQYRRASEFAERASGQLQPDDGDETRVLVVDHDGWLQSQLGSMVNLKPGFRLRGAESGGEALDLIGRERFQIALVRETLPDLPGSMVVRAIKQQTPETISLVYTVPTETKPGRIDVADVSRVIEFLPQFRDPGQILERLDELREAFRATSRERRYLAAFRQQHFDLLRKYAQLKQRLVDRTKA